MDILIFPPSSPFGVSHLPPNTPLAGNFSSSSSPKCRRFPSTLFDSLDFQTSSSSFVSTSLPCDERSPSRHPHPPMAVFFYYRNFLFPLFSEIICNLPDQAFPHSPIIDPESFYPSYSSLASARVFPDPSPWSLSRPPRHPILTESSKSLPSNSFCLTSTVSPFS